jgi:hypothetical protein
MRMFPSLFVIPSEAEGSAVPRTSPEKAESNPQTKLSSRPERSVVERSAVSFSDSRANNVSLEVRLRQHVWAQVEAAI